MDSVWNNKTKHSLCNGVKIIGKGVFGLSAVVGGMIVGCLFGSALGGLYALDFVAPEISIDFPGWLEKRIKKNIASETDDSSSDGSEETSRFVSEERSSDECVDETESVGSFTPTQLEFRDSQNAEETRETDDSDVSVETFARTRARESVALSPEVPETPILRSRTRARRPETQLHHA